MWIQFGYLLSINIFPGGNKGRHSYGETLYWNVKEGRPPLQIRGWGTGILSEIGYPSPFSQLQLRTQIRSSSETLEKKFWTGQYTRLGPTGRSTTLCFIWSRVSRVDRSRPDSLHSLVSLVDVSVGCWLDVRVLPRIGSRLPDRSTRVGSNGYVS